MIYYDRHLPEPLLATLRPGGALDWLVSFDSSAGQGQNLAHVQFRGNPKHPKSGEVQIYFGRTSPLTIKLQSRGAVKMTADTRYRRITPDLFAQRVALADLHAMRASIEQHLNGCADCLASSFVSGEARPHAGMLLRYGPQSDANSTLWAFDSEIRLGFGRATQRRRLNDELRSRLCLDAAVKMPTKLDALAILPGGELALVEVKKESGDLNRAVVQCATYVARFRELMAQSGTDLRSVVMRHAQQKVVAGLLAAAFRPLRPDVPLVPVIAAPDRREDWLKQWRAETQGLRSQLAGWLGDLQFWRLSDDGEVLEQEPA